MHTFISTKAAVAVFAAAMTLAACSSSSSSSDGQTSSVSNTRVANQPPVSTATPLQPAPVTTQTPAPAASPSDGVRRITTTELRDQLEKGEAVIVDVRSAEQYKVRHIKSAIHIPGNEITARAAQLPSNKLIVTYCS